jgi:hypothetical protein
MKTKFYYLTLFLALFFSVNSFGQITSIPSMLAGAPEDGEKMLQAYFKPYANAFGANLNGAWYNTAKVHKLGGFDLTLSISASFVPKADKEFDASLLGLSSGATVDPNNKMSPTIAGKKEAGATITYPALNNLSYNLPKGTGWGVIPSPMLQLGIGLVKGTDLTFRYVPDLNVGDFGSFGLWGVGLKHSIKQWIPAIKLMPFFNLSVFMGYSQMKTSADVSFKPEVYNAMLDPDPVDNTDLPFDNQKMEMTFKSFTTNVLASFDLPVVTFYGGIGFATNNTNLALLGDYPLPSFNTNTNNVEITNGEKDPIKIKMTSSSGTKPRFTGGIKFKMAIITFHVDYTYASYSLITSGLGISFR